MPATYTPINADAAAVAQKQIDRLLSISGIGDVASIPNPNDINTVGGGITAAIADTALFALGYQAQSDGAGLGAATTNSQTFVDIGNGTSTGFAAWTVSIPIAKTYLLAIDLSFFVTGAIGSAFFQVIVDGATTGVANPVNSSRQAVSTINLRIPKSWRVPIAFASAGSHTIKLQWRTDGPLVFANVNESDFRLFTVTG